MKINDIFLKVSFLTLFVLLGIAGGYEALASSKDDIIYPVAELGSCVNEQECRAYCEAFAHIKECLAFAEQHNLLSQEELAEARKFAQLGIQSGPGDCRGEESCQAYCENISHIRECLAFGEQHNIMSGEELEEARKVAQALEQGAQLPGGCQSKAQCEAYCEDTSHIRECLVFAEAAGLMHREELEEAKKVAQALEAGVQLPGGCRWKAECEVYCEEPSHINECLDFAEAAGFISTEELEDARRVAPLMARGEMPGGCRSREQCEAYCSDGAHTEECVIFFEKAGFISGEEAKMFRKTGGKGPGGCRGREECDTFCNSPENQAVCFDFAKQHGLIPEEELQNLQEGIGRFKEGFSNAPPEVSQCLKDRVGEKVLSKIEAGTFLPNPELGEQMRSCFEQFMPASQQGGSMPQGDFGPGHEGGFEQGYDGVYGVPSEARDCVQRILGDTGTLQGPPTPEQEQRIRQECFSQATEGFQGAPEQFEHSEGAPAEQFQQQFQQEFQARQREEFQRQYQEEYQRQFEQQYQEEYQRQLQQQTSEGFQSPEGFQPRESFTPPEEFQASQEFHEEPPPASGLAPKNFLGAVLGAMKLGLKRVISL